MQEATKDVTVHIAEQIKQNTSNDKEWQEKDILRKNNWGVMPAHSLNTLTSDKNIRMIISLNEMKYAAFQWI